MDMSKTQAINGTDVHGRYGDAHSGRPPGAPVVSAAASVIAAAVAAVEERAENPSQQDVIDCYEELAPLTTQMLEAARAADWEMLTGLEHIFREVVSRLRNLRPEDPPDDFQKERKYRLLQRILADDAEIRNLVTPQMKGLTELISTSQRRGKLNKAYNV